jgi:hypothetical protein
MVGKAACRPLLRSLNVHGRRQEAFMSLLIETIFPRKALLLLCTPLIDSVHFKSEDTLIFPPPGVSFR